jgi:hypothetical protein
VAIALAGAFPGAVVADMSCSLEQGLNGGTAPVAYSPHVDSYTTTTAHISAALDPGNAPTTYYFEYGRYPAGPLTRAASGSVDGCDQGDTVSTTLTGLTPGTNYELRLVTTNQYGTSTGESSFGTQSAPPPPPDVGEHPLVLLTTHSTDVSIGALVSIRARLLGHFQSAASTSGAPSLRLYYAFSPYHRWHLSAAQQPPASGRLSLSLGTKPGSDVGPTQNVRVRAQIGSSTSNTLTIYVEPQIYFNVTRADGGLSPDVIAYYSAETDAPLHGAYPRPVIYLYQGASSRGPFRRVGARRVRRTGPGSFGTTILAARFVVRDPGRHEYVTCTPRPLLADTGRPFSSSTCGRRRIS